MVKRSEEDLVQYILRRSEEIYNTLSPGVPTEWLSSDLTVAQLRILLVLQSRGPTRMSDIASTLSVTLPSATGIVENLVKKGLVERETDSKDRRLVICKMSPAGQESINRLWSSGQFQMERLLDGLSLVQLRKAADVADILFSNVSGKAEEVTADETIA
ncbi:MAG: MarR family transcriptional regulator [Dehalococcoidales bacterium]|nr:MarR family transcriptional regulator [Dehalococcoidales bacterium]